MIANMKTDFVHLVRESARRSGLYPKLAYLNRRRCALPFHIERINERAVQQRGFFHICEYEIGRCFALGHLLQILYGWCRLDIAAARAKMDVAIIQIHIVQLHLHLRLPLCWTSREATTES